MKKLFVVVCVAAGLQIALAILFGEVIPEYKAEKIHSCYEALFLSEKPTGSFIENERFFYRKPDFVERAFLFGDVNKSLQQKQNAALNARKDYHGANEQIQELGQLCETSSAGESEACANVEAFKALLVDAERRLKTTQGDWERTHNTYWSSISCARELGFAVRNIDKNEDGIFGIDDPIVLGNWYRE